MLNRVELVVELPPWRVNPCGSAQKPFPLIIVNPLDLGFHDAIVIAIAQINLLY
jgi:hypothetical protein